MTDWLLSIGRYLVKKFSAKSPNEFQEMQQYYQDRIEFMKQEVEDQKVIIEKYRHKNPDNGVELDAWKQREEKLLQEKITLLRELLSLKSQLLFWEKMRQDANSKVKDSPN